MEYIIENIENDDTNKANSSLKMKKDMISFLKKNYNGNNMLEFGTAGGNTTAVLAQICKEKGGKIYTIDLRKERLEISKKLLRKLNLSEYVVFIQADLYKDNWQKHIDHIEFSFIDAVHKVKAVEIDTQNAIKLGSKYICYHDYGLNLIKQNYNSNSAVKIYLSNNKNIYTDKILIGEEKGKWIRGAGTNDYEGCIIKVSE